MAKISKEEEQDLLDRLLPDSGYVVDPEPQRDSLSPNTRPEKTADDDSLKRMYPDPDTKSQPRKDSKGARQDVASAGATDASKVDDVDSDVITVSGRDTTESQQEDTRHKPGTRKRRTESDSTGEDDDMEEVYFIPVKPKNASSDRGRGPGRKVIVVSKTAIKGYQG